MHVTTPFFRPGPLRPLRQQEWWWGWRVGSGDLLNLPVRDIPLYFIQLFSLQAEPVQFLFGCLS